LDKNYSMQALGFAAV